MSEQQPPQSRGERRKAQKKQKTVQKSSVSTWIKRVILAIVIIGFVGLLSGLGLFTYYASKAPELDEELLKDPISAEFFDKNGDIFATIGVEQRIYVEYDDIPQDMIDAILATEDVRFFDHQGIDFLRLASAVVANVTDGFGSQGASTITQQVVKNSFFTNEKTLERKAQEAYLAYKLEQEYSKEEIFEMYFNKSLMSGRIYGFGTAAKYFYGKELNELSLDEMATLAGMPQSPNNYNPFNYPENAENRRNIVLSLMVQHEKIDQATADAAKNMSVVDTVLPEGERNQFTSSDYPAFLQVVLEEVENLQADGAEFTLDEGVKIHTTLDPEAQKIVEQQLADDANFPTEDIQTGVAVVDTKTGALRAIGGGRNYGEERGWNYAYNLNRSPGSTIKPLAVYGPAINTEQLSSGTTIVDEPYAYSDGTKFGNWDSRYHGAETLRYALSTSRNVPAVKLMQEIGTETSAEFMSRLGITIPEHGVYESDALGSGNVSMSPIEMAGAYAAFGNNGVFTEPYVIASVEYRDGSSDNFTPESVVAMEDYTAYMITDILRDVVASDGSARRAGVDGVDVAGKTGTTNYSDPSKYPSGAVPDTWFAGYSPNYTLAIWGGYENSTTPITTWDERYMPQVLFKGIMTDLSDNLADDLASEKFKKPKSVYEQRIVVGSNPLRVASTGGRVELFVRGGTSAVQKAPEKPKEDENEQQETTKLPAPTGFSASANGATANLSWSYNKPKGIDAVQFEVHVSIDGGAAQAVTTTSSTSASFSPLEQGKNYTFTVVAVANGQRSAATATAINLANGTEQPEEEPEEEQEETPPVEETPPTDPNEEQNNGGSNNNNNNNNGNNQGGSNNGQDTNNGNEQPTEPEQPVEPEQPAEPEQPVEPTTPVEPTPPPNNEQTDPVPPEPTEPNTNTDPS